MKLRNVFVGLTMAFLLPFMSTNVFAAEPSINDVYQAAEAGKYQEADTMMQQVLRNHPDSGKAHFVNAELMAKEGRLAEAKAELATAERLKPGLPFAKPAAVEALKARLAAAHGVHSNVSTGAAPNSGFPWGLFLVIAGLVAIVVIVVRMMSQRPQVIQSAPLGGGSGPIMPYGTAGVGQAGPAGGGMGSTILGGLATGAAVGAGMVAGEALMHRILDDKSSGNAPAQPEPASSDFSPQYDMGGDDFGVSDSSSWDDSSDVGGSDWD